MSSGISTRPSHLGLCCVDLVATMRFYCEGLGFSPVERYDLDSSWLPGLDLSLEVAAPVALRSQMIVLDTMKIELLHFSTPGPVGSASWHRNEIGLTHLSFVVADVDSVAAQLAELGGTILAGTRANLGVDLVFLSDPDGVRVELMAEA